MPTEPTEGAVRRLEDQLAELRDRHARLAAEFDNYRKRMARERLEGEGIQRVFAAEVGRSIGDKKIVGELKFVRADDKVGIELAPGRAVEWTEQTYPFNQDKGPVGGFEPLLLPWGGAQPARYVWNGSTFAK